MLRTLQRRVGAALMRPLTPEEAMNEENAPLASELIKPNSRLSAFERLQIYNQQYWWRVLGSLREDFPGLRAVLGEQRFEHLAVAYLQACPSRSWSLRDLGAQLEGFVLENPHFTMPNFGLALDMVRVEWARILAFDGPEIPKIDPKRIGNLPPHRLKLRLQPYLSLLGLWHPIDLLLTSLKTSRPTAPQLSNALASSRQQRRKPITAAPLDAPLFLAVHRHSFSVYFKRLEPEAFALLSLLRGGATLGEACEAAFAHSALSPEASAAKVQAWFVNWMQLGWFGQASRNAQRRPAC